MYEFLKRNAKYFEEYAQQAYKEKSYKFVLFFVEQALQLYIKYILAKNFEDYPRTHKLKLLFEELSSLDPRYREFYEEYADVIDLLEEAYITSRYLDKEYSEKSAKKALDLLVEFKEQFKQWLQ